MEADLEAEEVEEDMEVPKRYCNVAPISSIASATGLCLLKLAPAYVTTASVLPL